jgi:hypothetical protein
MESSLSLKTAEQYRVIGSKETGFSKCIGTLFAMSLQM